MTPKRLTLDGSNVIYDTKRGKKKNTIFLNFLYIIFKYVSYYEVYIYGGIIKGFEH